MAAASVDRCTMFGCLQAAHPPASSWACLEDTRAQSASRLCQRVLGRQRQSPRMRLQLFGVLLLCYLPLTHLPTYNARLLDEALDDLRTHERSLYQTMAGEPSAGRVAPGRSLAVTQTQGPSLPHHHACSGPGQHDQSLAALGPSPSLSHAGSATPAHPFGASARRPAAFARVRPG